jgi:hypothetical protein
MNRLDTTGFAWARDWLDLTRYETVWMFDPVRWANVDRFDCALEAFAVGARVADRSVVERRKGT